MAKFYVKKINTFLVALFGFSLCFAQEVPPKLAVYVSGAENAGVNKSLSVKLFVAMTQNGNYTEIADPVPFQDELAKSSKSDLAYIAQAAQRRGAEYVCVVSMTEAFGSYSITARLAGVSDLQIVKTAVVDHSLKSMDDLSAVSSELARQLLPQAEPSIAVEKEEVPVAAPKECTKKYNINELLYKVKEGFPVQLKDCASTLAKDMLTPASLGGHKLVPASFMKQCPIDGIKKELPDGFPGVDKFLVSLTNFVQTLMNSALAGGSLDPKKLVSVVASMDIKGLLDEVNKLSEDPCVVDEPYEPPVAQGDGAEEWRRKRDERIKKEKENSVSFGIRAGINLSHTYAHVSPPRFDNFYRTNGDYGDVLGMQAGFVVDFPVTGVFHIQPGLMYIQKGMEDSGDVITAHYIELPLLLSFKLDALRLNAGPYLGLCVWEDYLIFKVARLPPDIGLNLGLSYDIGMFYIGVFYEHDFMDMSNEDYFSFYNRTFGLNFGINL